MLTINMAESDPELMKANLETMRSGYLALLRQFKNSARHHHSFNHDPTNSWRQCRWAICAANRPVIEQAEQLLFGKIQRD